MNRIRSGLGIATARIVGTMTSLNFQHPISLNFTSLMPYEGTPRVGCHMTTPSYSIYISRSNLVPLRRQKWGRPCGRRDCFLVWENNSSPESSWLVCCGNQESIALVSLWVSPLQQEFWDEHSAYEVSCVWYRLALEVEVVYGYTWHWWWVSCLLLQ